ncbi:MAG: hypothetical protein HGB14_01175, partial [Anaerolineaceae bacterium]|nr:hypothetical protein [Anaerolineaceae bacterium]
MTKTNLRNYLLWFEQSVTSVTASGRRAINCTEGGARIAGFEQRPLADVLSEFPPLAFDPRQRLAELTGIEPMDAESWRKFIAKLFDRAAEKGTTGIKQL